MSRFLPESICKSVEGIVECQTYVPAWYVPAIGLLFLIPLALWMEKHKGEFLR